MHCLVLIALNSVIGKNIKAFDIKKTIKLNYACLYSIDTVIFYPLCQLYKLYFQIPWKIFSVDVHLFCVLNIGHEANCIRHGRAYNKFNKGTRFHCRHLQVTNE